jgi:hypothetical protein
MRTYRDIFSCIQSSPVFVVVETKLWVVVQLPYIPTSVVPTFAVPLVTIHEFIL